MCSGAFQGVMSFSPYNGSMMFISHERDVAPGSGHSQITIQDHS